MSAHHIVIATPCYGGVVGQGYMQSVVALMAAAPSRGLDLTLALLGQDALITRCRNTLVSQFMAIEQATHLLFVDADISFAPRDVFRLLDADKALVAGIYPLKAYYWDASCRDRLAGGEMIDSAGLHYVGMADDQPGRSENGLVAATRAGTGFMLIQRDVIRQLQAAYPETAYTAIDAYQTGGHASPNAHALFDCAIDPSTGVYMSEDFTFCDRWRRIGGEIWLDTEGELTHTGPCDFHGRPHRRFG